MRPSQAAPAALLLDAMGTLVHLAAPVPALRAELAARFGLQVSEGEAQRALAAEIGYYRAHLQDGDTPSALAALRERCAAVLRSALPPSPGLEAVPDGPLTEALLAALRFEAYADARPALAAARRRGIRTVVVSNWDCSLGQVLHRVGLGEELDEVLTSAEVGAAKPSPVIFERALELAGCEPGRALHVGDSVEEDVAGAHAAGVPVVLIARDGSPPPPGVPAIASLGELAAIAGTAAAGP